MKGGRLKRAGTPMASVYWAFSAGLPESTTGLASPIGPSLKKFIMAQKKLDGYFNWATR